MAFSKAEEFEEKDILAARFAKALSHPARIAIVRLLANHITAFEGAERCRSDRW